MQIVSVNANLSGALKISKAMRASGTPLFNSRCQYASNPISSTSALVTGGDES
jgi:hypothetical protein